MKKTVRNQNMTDQRSKHNEKVSTGSSMPRSKKGKPERYGDSNINQPVNKNRQRYDDYTGTVENGIG